MIDARVFEDLKLVAAQLAGFLVLEGSGARIDPLLLVSAERVYKSAVDSLKSARAPERHLLEAAEKLGDAIREMQVNRDALPLLKGAYADLWAAAKTEPGLLMISFERGCCAEAHRPAGPLCAEDK
jgi:hypothetical protein